MFMAFSIKHMDVFIAPIVVKSIVKPQLSIQARVPVTLENAPTPGAGRA